MPVAGHGFAENSPPGPYCPLTLTLAATFLRCKGLDGTHVWIFDFSSRTD